MVDRHAGALPTGVADAAPGPALGEALAAVDPSTLNGHHLVELAAAYVRQISHLQAGLAIVLNQAQHCPPGDADSPPERSGHATRWGEVELAAKLRWSAAKAGYELRYAHHLVRRLPVVHAALAAGLIDWPRARTMVDCLSCVDDEPAQQIAAHTLASGAAAWDRRRLADRLRRAVIAYDPDAATKRQRERLAARRVTAEAHPDGTANLYGWDLPPQRVAEIVERLSATARASKRAGDTRSMDQLWADIFCDLLAGMGLGATPPGPVSDPDPDPAGDLDNPTTDDPAFEPDPPEDDGPRQSGATPLAAVAPTPAPGPRRGVVELTVPLSTLIGLSQAPGLLAGYGPVVADICRRIAIDRPDAQWRYSVFDDLTTDGQLAYHGITQARPTKQDGFSAADAAYLRARDRTCRGPQGCHTPASACDLDHTLAKVDGGGHYPGNGGPLCRREHMFKHQSGATLTQPEPGVFEWTTPLGHVYVRPDPYDESTGPPPLASPASQRLKRLLKPAR